MEGDGWLRRRWQWNRLVFENPRNGEEDAVKGHKSLNCRLCAALRAFTHYKTEASVLPPVMALCAPRLGPTIMAL